MLSEKPTVIVTTTEDLLPLFTKAVRAAIEDEKRGGAGSQQGKRLLAPTDVEREFGIHRKMLAEWRSEGIGRAYTTFGRRVLYERSVIEDNIVSKRIKTSGYSGA